MWHLPQQLDTIYNHNKDEKHKGTKQRDIHHNKNSNYCFDKENIFGLKNIGIRKWGTVSRKEVEKRVAEREE